MTAALRREVVSSALDELGAEAVCALLGGELRGTGAHRRTKTCPACGDRTRTDAVVVTVATGLWHCKVCGAGGTLLDYAALALGCDPKGDFPGALETVASFAGVEPGSPLDAQERARRNVERRQAQKQAERQRFEQARRTASEYWATLGLRHEAGERYLAGRGLDALIGRSDLVRFHADGAVAIQLHGLDDSAVMSVVRRQLPPREPKQLCLAGCPTSGAFGRLAELDSTTGHVFVVEGLFDFLTAELLLRPHGNLVLGAQGAGNLPKLVAAVSPELARRRRRFCFVVHEDNTGGSCVERALATALSAGVVFEPEIDLFNLGGAADLNDALVKGTGDVRDC